MQDIGLILPPPPSSTQRRIAIRVNSAAESALRHGHPWLYENAITKQSHVGEAGDLAVIFNKQRNFLAIGLFDPTSIIRVRVLQHNKPAIIDHNWFKEKINLALQIRIGLPEDTSAFRLVNGENDGLPGVVIDLYNQSIVIKIYSVAWIPYISTLVSILKDLLSPERIVLRLGRVIQSDIKSHNNLDDGQLIYGSPLDGPVQFHENGIKFEADLKFGHKTGFYLDQRDNRARVEKISKAKNILNVFSYTGGFSVYAARGGAHKVTSLDLSRPALISAERNFAYNQDNPAIANCSHETQAGDAFKILTQYAQANNIFDMVIIDPPAFAKKQSEQEKAIGAYRRLTRIGLKILAPGGILVQSSCSSRISKPVFINAVLQAAQQIGRPLIEIEYTGHAIDHPISFPEGEYLKCLFATG